MKSKLFALGASLTLMLAGCGNNAPAKVKVESVSLNQTSATLIVGDRLQLEATVNPDNATDKTVTWSATGDDIVSVEDGYVTALKAGQSTVTVTTTDGGLTASCAITVNNPVVHVTSVSLDQAAVTMVAGDELTLTATVLPANADDKSVTWSATGDAVTVNNGVVTAVKAGSSMVKVTTTDGNKEAECVITVVSDAMPKGTYLGKPVLQYAGTTATFDLVIALGTLENQLVAVKMSNKYDAEPTGFTYSKVTQTLEIETKGKFVYAQGIEFTYGKLSATYDEATDSLKNVAIDGTIAEYVSNNGEFACSKITTMFDCDGTTQELQGQFKRRFMSGSWQVDKDNTDRFLHEDNCVSGTGAMSVRPCGTGFDAYAVNLQADLDPAVTVKNLGFWVYNPSTTTDVKFREWIYKGTNLTNNAEIGELTAKAGGWSYVCMGFTQAAVLNIQISVWKNQNANGMNIRLIFDNIVLF